MATVANVWWLRWKKKRSCALALPVSEVSVINDTEEYFLLLMRDCMVDYVLSASGFAMLVSRCLDAGVIAFTY